MKEPASATHTPSPPLFPGPHITRTRVLVSGKRSVISFTTPRDAFPISTELGTPLSIVYSSMYFMDFAVNAYIYLLLLIQYSSELYRIYYIIFDIICNSGFTRESLKPSPNQATIYVLIFIKKYFKGAFMSVQITDDEIRQIILRRKRKEKERKRRKKRIALAICLVFLAGILGFSFSTGGGIFTLFQTRGVIFIDAGHGGEDPGAEALGRKEKDDTLELALKVRKYLRRKRFKVVMSRTDGGANVDRPERAEMANEAEAKLMVSLHRNQSDGEGQGVEAWIHSGGNSSATLLADNILRNLEKEGFTCRKSAAPAHCRMLLTIIPKIGTPPCRPVSLRWDSSPMNPITNALTVTCPAMPRPLPTALKPPTKPFTKRTRKNNSNRKPGNPPHLQWISGSAFISSLRAPYRSTHSDTLSAPDPPGGTAAAHLVRWM